MVSHTHNHVNLREQTPQVQHEEMRLSRDWLQKNGFNADVIVYPFGGRDGVTMDIARQYYEAGVYIDNGQRLNATPISTYDLQRVYFNDAPGDTGQVQRCKDKIDEAVLNNSWIIIGMHCHYDAFTPANLIEVIQYAKSKGIEIVTMKRGLELYANVLELPDFVVDAKGTLISNKLGRMQKMISNADNVTPLSSFPVDSFSYRVYNNSAATTAGFPENKAGTLLTFRAVSDDYGYQNYILSATNTKYSRVWINSTLSWTSWEKDTVPTTSPQLSTNIVDIQKMERITHLQQVPTNLFQQAVGVTGMYQRKSCLLHIKHFYFKTTTPAICIQV
ncbi:polysaccharide deacetylase family protein [Cytobacillus oceanisediminis]|nr:polysaccharide deacetylase family protein [Cytobacillus oceanisediminis]